MNSNGADAINTTWLAAILLGESNVIAYARCAACRLAHACALYHVENLHPASTCVGYLTLALRLSNDGSCVWKKEKLIVSGEEM
jgi:hypothetical protein